MLGHDFVPTAFVVAAAAMVEKTTADVRLAAGESAGGDRHIAGE